MTPLMLRAVPVDTVGVRAYEELLSAAKLNGIPFSRGRFGDGVFANGVVVSYDPADCWDENAPTEWLYIKRRGVQLCEGGVNLDRMNPEKALYRVDLEGPEIILPSHGALVGMMLVRLMDAITGRV